MLAHRWIGIAACLLCTIWCLSGIVLIYVVQPHLTEKEYVAGLNPIDWGQVHLDPTAALRAAQLQRFPAEMRLEMQRQRPVYRMTDWKGVAHVVSAVEGSPIGSVDASAALEIARAFAHSNKPTWLKTVVSDRWTYKAAFDKTRPFQLIALNDRDDRQLYVSARTGTLVLDTTKGDRFWSWFARVPHLIELPFERSSAAPWRQFLLWSTGLSSVLAFSGLWLGFTRLSLVKRYGGGRVTPFRGWLLWHHILGLIGGLTLLTWITTAFIYLKPNHLLERPALPTTAMQRYIEHTGADFPLRLDQLIAAAPKNTVSAGFTWLAGQPLTYITDVSGRTTTADGATGSPMSLNDQQLLHAARRLVPGAPVIKAERRTTPDRYWHSFKGNFRKLPMFRVEFGDPDKTWLHLDATTGALMGTMQEPDRTYFLAFNEIHKFDYYSVREPGRQILVWFLMLMGTGISTTGVVVGFKHLTRPNPKRRKASAASPKAVRPY